MWDRGPGNGTRMGHCILCQTFTLQLMWELKQVLYFGIVSALVPVPVPFPHKFCLNKPSLFPIVPVPFPIPVPVPFPCSVNKPSLFRYLFGVSVLDLVELLFESLRLGDGLVARLGLSQPQRLQLLVYSTRNFFLRLRENKTSFINSSNFYANMPCAIFLE